MGFKLQITELKPRLLLIPLSNDSKTLNIYDLSFVVDRQPALKAYQFPGVDVVVVVEPKCNHVFCSK